jgi:nicotinamidase-related amidase
VQGTEGAAFVDGLDVEKFHFVIEKGQETLVEAYSAFTDTWGLFPSKLEKSLNEAGIKDLYVVGLGMSMGTGFADV